MPVPLLSCANLSCVQAMACRMVQKDGVQRLQGGSPGTRTAPMYRSSTLVRGRLRVHACTCVIRLLTCLAPLAACNPDTVEEVKAVEARDMSILGSRAKQTLFNYRYCFDVTRPVPYMSQGKLDATLEV